MRVFRSSHLSSTRRPRGIAALLAVALVLPLGVAGVTRAAGDQYSAKIRWTSHGIPHIVADDFGGIGYGYGYAFASQNLCVIADDYVTVNAQRSKYFGPDAGYTIAANDASPTNLQSDFFWQNIIDEGTVDRLLAQEPPLGPVQGVRDGIAGYVAGYNRYLDETGVDGLPDPRCRGAEWVRQITEKDVYLRFFQLMLLASSGALMEGIVDAQPPLTATAAIPQARLSAALRKWDGTGLPGLKTDRLGSNAYGLGKDATDNGLGMVLGNPHFPWDGPERFYQTQLTIPGVVDVEGASLFGVPLILIGHNEHVAWSHTVSTAWRFTPYELALVPGSPTSYMYDGEVRQMTSRTVAVKVKLADGTLADRTHTFWSTHFGPMFAGIPATDSPVGPINIFNWTPTTAYALRDVNIQMRALNQFFGMNAATSVEDLKHVTDTYQGIPWVNTTGADDTGTAYYADHSVVPHVTDAQITECVNGLVGKAVWELAALPVLDGSRSLCEWGSDSDAVVPGIFGPGHLPWMFRDDYTHNSNDSYWLTNPRHPLEGYPRIIGNERTPRTLRTRVGLRILEDRLAGNDGRPGRRFTITDLQELAFGNRQYAGELFRDAAVTMCRKYLGPTDIKAACPVIAAWDVHDNIDSAGAVLFRRFVERVLPLDPYTTAFDFRDAVNTPKGLDTSDPQVQQALADAVADLQGSGIPLDAKLGDYQYEMRGDVKIPIHGGPGQLGNFNAIGNAGGWQPGEGYPDIDFGSSFVMTVQFTGESCPVRGGTWITYSQSSNPESPFFGDQTSMFSRKEWNPIRFCEQDIASDPAYSVVNLS
ncbi:MAG: penicillin acylase family protein [Actinomycetota bacterium]